MGEVGVKCSIVVPLGTLNHSIRLGKSRGKDGEKGRREILYPGGKDSLQW